MKEGGLTGMYYDYAMAAPLMVSDKAPSDMKVLILGMGTGTYATQCRKYFGDMAIEGVEIDEKITDLFLCRRMCRSQPMMEELICRRLMKSMTSLWWMLIRISQSLSRCRR